MKRFLQQFAIALCFVTLGGCARHHPIAATQPAGMSDEAQAWAPLRPLAGILSVIDAVADGPPNFRVIKQGADHRVIAAPPEVKPSTGPWAEEIPVTISDDDSAGERHVLSSGQSVHAVTPNGELTIEFVSPERRRIIWQDDLNEGTGAVYSQEVKLYPRGIWYGVAGKYARNDRRFGFGEGEMRAKSLEDAMKIMRVAPSMCYTMSSTGLIVGYYPDNGTVAMDLIQLYINDKIPSDLVPMNGGNVKLLP